MKNVLILDSSQISQYMDCPMAWNYNQVEAITLYEGQTKVAIQQGILGHRLLDVFYKLRAEGVDYKTSVASVFTFDIDKDECACKHSLMIHDGVGGCKFPSCPCVNFAPKEFELSQPNRDIVFNRMRDYFFKWQVNDFQADNPDSVEVGFSEPIYEDDDKIFVLEGRIDLLGSLQGVSVVVDHKFQTRAHELDPKSIQFKNYALVGKRITFIVNYIRLTKKVEPDTLQRVITNFNTLELSYWKQELIRIFNRVYLSKFGGLGYEQRWNACSGKYGYMCEYKELCDASYNPQLVQILKQSKYKPREVWKPW